jgi:hypothetical protein
MPSLIRRIVATASPFLLLGAHGCLPYTVGSTARTVPAHQTTNSTSWYYIPNAVRMPSDSIPGPLAGANFELRHGLDSRTDFGVLLMPASGVAIDYKRRLDGDASGTRTAYAYSVGAGIVNAGAHFMMQGTLIASGREDGLVAPYGGMRVIHVLPIAPGAVSDRPTIGMFGGVQLGDADFTIRPELGVFYDHSALGLRRGDVIFVPAVTLRRGRRREFRVNDAAPRPTASPAGAADPRRTPIPIYAPRPRT